jgi:hypothetical protein
VLCPERQLLNVPLVDVAVPKLDDGDKAVKMHGAPHDVGPYLLSVALVRAQVPALSVFEFARAWAGDAYVPFRRDGAPCARIAIQSVQPADLTAVQNALTAFVSTRPTGSAAVATDDASGAVVLTTCGSVAGSAPPVATKIATGASLPSFFELVLLRSVVLGEPLGGSAKTVSFTDRRCLADEVIRFAAVRPWPSDGEGQRALGDEAGRHAARTCPGLSVAGANDPSTVASTAPAAAPADPAPDPAADLATAPADPAAAPGG